MSDLSVYENSDVRVLVSKMNELRCVTSYFASLRAEVLSRAIPKGIVVLDGCPEYVYSDSVNCALREIEIGERIAIDNCLEVKSIRSNYDEGRGF